MTIVNITDLQQGQVTAMIHVCIFEAHAYRLVVSKVKYDIYDWLVLELSAGRRLLDYKYINF